MTGQRLLSSVEWPGFLDLVLRVGSERRRIDAIVAALDIESVERAARQRYYRGFAMQRHGDLGAGTGGQVAADVLDDRLVIGKGLHREGVEVQLQRFRLDYPWRLGRHGKPQRGGRWRARRLQPGELPGGPEIDAVKR